MHLFGKPAGWATKVGTLLIVSAAAGLLGRATGADAVAQREASGDIVGARSLLEQQIHEHDDAGSEAALAEFLDRHHAAGRRDAFAKWASLETDPARRQMALRQVLLLDFMDGRKTAIQGDLEQYRAAGATDFSAIRPFPKSSRVYGTIEIPGPLSSFARMAALSPDLAPDDLLPALARNVVTNGYQAVASNESLEQTEYLKLVIRYVSQGRELAAMAGAGHKIVIPTCDSDQTGNLLRIIGYRMRGSCGSDVVLETVNATRAFVTVDSAFPLAELEQDLRANRKFEFEYAPTSIPVLYGPDYWLSALGSKGSRPNFIDAFLNDPSLCRLYLGLSKLDSITAEEIKRKIPFEELQTYAPVLDFFGSMFEVKNGVAVVPGSARAWTELVGVSPNEGAGFYRRLIERDDGWMASYFDALARLNGPGAEYLEQPERMKRFYNAVRGRITTPGPARPVFRSSTDLMLLTTSLRIDANGQPHIPGDIQVWKTLFIKHPRGKYDAKLSRAASAWRAPDDVLEALFALCRKSVENEPLHIFLALNDIDRMRTHPISADLASRLVALWREAGDQYPILADSSVLSEASINLFLDYINQSGDIHDTLVRADSLGCAQSLVGLWQILGRDGAIPAASEDRVFAAMLSPFAKARQSADVFDAARNGVRQLLDATHAPAAEPVQDRLVDLLAGPLQVNPEHPGPAEKLIRVYDAQLLISLDNLFAFADSLTSGSPNKAATQAITTELARFEEAQSMRGSLSGEEKNMLSLGYWSERHIEQERKLNLDALVKDSDKRAARGKLTPFLRDSLVGLLYAYYSPPGAQLILANPLFVRNHDFIGAEGLRMSWRSTEINGTGWPASAGGRLMGSLVGLPYSLAEAEQNFLTPTREQALIWADLVPQMIVDVTVPSWRTVTETQLHWVGLNMRHGEDLLAESAFDPAVEALVMRSLGRFANPARIEQIEEHLHDGDFAQARSAVLPSEIYALSTDASLAGAPADAATAELSVLRDSGDASLSPRSIATAFGTPKPTLTHSYEPGLLYLRTFPTLMGYSSRLLAESWESNGFYYGAIADELGIPASQLDSYLPDWTRETVENIFATHLDDWPALLRSLRTVGDNLRQQSGLDRATGGPVNAASN